MEERIVIRIDAPSLPQISKRPAFKRVAAYARVSTSSEEQLNSVEAQKSYYKEYIGRHKEWVFAGLYTDEGISGLSYLRREGFNLMINDAYAGKIDLIVTKSISRFARNTVDTLTHIRKLKEKGIAVYFEKEDINKVFAQLPCFPIDHSGLHTSFLGKVGFREYDSMPVFCRTADRDSLSLKRRIEHHLN